MLKKSCSVTVRMDPNLYDKLAAYANDRHETVSHAARKLIDVCLSLVDYERSRFDRSGTPVQEVTGDE